MSVLSRLAWFTANLFGGVVPTLLFFVWVEQGASLPWLSAQPSGVGTLSPERIAGRVLVNLALFALFGTTHSLLAQVKAQDRLRRLVPAPAMRTAYLCCSGAALFLLMALWRPTGIVLWHGPAGL